MTGSIWTLRSRPEPKLFRNNPPGAPPLYVLSLVINAELFSTMLCAQGRPPTRHLQTHPVFVGRCQGSPRQLCRQGSPEDTVRTLPPRASTRERPRGLLAPGPTPEAGLPAAPSVPHVRFGLPASEARDSLQDSGAPSTGEHPKAGSGKAEGPCSPRPPQPPKPPTHHWM